MEKFQFLLINYNFQYSVAESLLPGFTTTWPGEATCSHLEEATGVLQKHHGSGRLILILLVYEGGIKRLSFSLVGGNNKDLLECLDNQE